MNEERIGKSAYDKWNSRTSFRGLLLTRKLLNQGFLFAKLKSSLRIFYGHFVANVMHGGDYVYPAEAITFDYL
jgi:hypothetical protein